MRCTFCGSPSCSGVCSADNQALNEYVFDNNLLPMYTWDHDLLDQPILVNEPHAVKRVKGDHMAPPDSCRHCHGDVKLTTNAVIYGKVYGWPLMYMCRDCRARVGCHPGTDIPLGTLANSKEISARKAAHAVFDPLAKTLGGRTKAYQALAKCLGVAEAHISWMGVDECNKVIELCKTGALERMAKGGGMNTMADKLQAALQFKRQ